MGKIAKYTEILQLAKEGKTLKEIVQTVGVGKHYIVTKLRANNYKHLTPGSGSKPSLVPNNPFDSSPESWYWLGYLAADGSITKGRIAFSQQNRDLEMVDKYGAFIGAPCKTYLTTKEKRPVRYCIFSNTKVVEYLATLGIFERKSLTIKLNFELNWHFFRGLFDGDGHVAHRNGRRACICTGSPFLKEQLVEFLTKEGVSTYCAINKGVFVINLHGKTMDILYTKMYKDATIYSPRKKKVFDGMCKEHQAVK